MTQLNEHIHDPIIRRPWALAITQASLRRSACFAPDHDCASGFIPLKLRRLQERRSYLHKLRSSSLH